MKITLLVFCLLIGASCTKPKEEYRQAISDIQRQESIERQEEVQKEEVPPEALPLDERSRGSNDAEGMGMDE